MNMMKKLLFMMTFLSVISFIKAQSITITEADGWLESAYAKWEPVEDAETYNVYYSGEGISNKKIDDQLIRNYGDYFRADVVGLKAGSYTLRIAAVIDGEETSLTETNTLTVLPYDRTGFAFANGRVPGAYKADGTIKDNAVILYITEKSKNTITMDVTGANANPCVGLQEILDGFKKGGDNRALVIRFVGQITDLAYMDKGDIVVENKNNASSYITLEGIGDDAVIDGFGIRIKSASNLEIRNLGTMNCDSNEGDNISLQQDNDYIWVHNCDFFYGAPGKDSDQAKGDGALDCKKSNYITFSYNHFWDSGKCNLLGLSEGNSVDRYITYHHNWYDHSDSRHPRVRFFTAHVYNNYYDGNAKYGIGSTCGSSVFSEKNYFRNCAHPMMISMQGTDTNMGADEKDRPTFSKEDGGIIKSFDDIMVGNFTFVGYSDENTVHFDSYVAKERNETVPSNVKSKKGENTYNNFDTNSSIMYDYTPHEASEVVGVVTKYAGRLKGGDFKWTFNNDVDDTSYNVNPELRTAVTNYKTSLVSIQGDTEGNTGGNDGDEDGDNDNNNNNSGNGGSVIEGDIYHNFTTNGLTSSYFTFTNGNLSDSKGTVIYGDMTLTQCLKVESKTEVAFTVDRPAKMVLVFNSTFSKKVLIDDVSYSVTNGILEVNLEAGNHTIKKGDTSNLYYIGLDTETSSDSTGTSIDKNTAMDNITVYPNPVSDYLNINSESDVVSIQIFNLTGSRMMEINDNVKSVDLSGLSNSVYIIRVVTENGTLQQRIINR